MNLKTARIVLASYIPDVSPEPGRRIREALHTVNSGGETDPETARQFDFDHAAARHLSAFPLSPEAIEKTREAAHRLKESAKAKHTLLDPTILTVVIGFIALIILGVIMLLSNREKFPGASEVIAIAETGAAANASQYDEVITEVGLLGDWFAMKGFDGYLVSDDLAPLESVGARVFFHEGLPIACIAIPESQSLLYVFYPVPLGVELDEKKGWTILESGKLTIAVKKFGPVCLALAVRGDKKDIAAVLENLPAGRNVSPTPKIGE